VVAKIGVLNVGSYSHGGAVTRLGVALARLGHDVIGWGPEASREAVEASGARFELHDPDIGSDINSHLELAAALAAATDRCTGELLDALFEHDVDLIVHDIMVPWGRIAADFLGLPRIACQPGFPGVGPPVPPAPDPDRPLGQLQSTRLAIARKWRVELGHWQNVLMSPGTATVALTTERIAARRKLAPDWRYVGPLLDPPPPTQPRGARPLVYASIGTTFNWRLEPFRALIEGLADEPVEVLVSTGRGKISPVDLGPLPDNVTANEFVQQRDVLARADIHITHGGCNSVHETFLAGVPMVCMPQAADQFAMTERVAQLGAGRTVKETPAAVRDGVRWLLDDGRPRARARQLGRHLAAYDGEARVARLVEQLLAESAAISA
jgi:MGT family glycosyltransferase